MHKPLIDLIPSLGRFLYTQNPFYLIGTLLVLVGVQHCLGREPTLATSGLIVAVLSGYTVLLSAAATVVIRYGKVWDDARTILLVIVLLFFMLSTSLDFHLLFTLEAPWPGTWLLLSGLLFSFLLSEALLRGLRIGLDASYRVPYYLSLLLLFTYPIALGWMNYHSRYESLSWALFAFPPLGALVLLSLLPAARRPAWHEPKSGTPWRWPFYPWSLFIVVTIGLAIRAWWLTIAFEPAKGPDAYFRPYFLFPLVVAWAVLVLEMGIARRASFAVAGALVLPLTGLVFGFPGPAQSLVEAAFLDRLVQTIGSPAQLTLGGMLLFYGYAWLRGAHVAEGLVVAVGTLFGLIGRETLDWSSLSGPNPLPLAAVAGILLGRAVHRQSTWRAIAGSALAMTSAQFAAEQFGSGGAGFWQWHTPPIGLLLLSAVFDDVLARKLRTVAWRSIPVLAFVAALAYPWALPSVAPATLGSYLALLLLASLILWLRCKSVQTLVAALATFGANVTVAAYPVTFLLRQTALAGGLPWLGAGILVVAAAFVISLVKMGALLRIREWLVSANAVLTGPTHAPP
jgi:hypothetical protein